MQKSIVIQSHVKVLNILCSCCARVRHLHYVYRRMDESVVIQSHAREIWL